MSIYCDNKVAFDISHNPVQHDRTKNSKVNPHFINEKLEAQIIIFPFVKIIDQLADVLIKVVYSRMFFIFLNKLGIRDIFTLI